MEIFCEYCRSKIDIFKYSKCPNCGAAYEKNKTFIEMQEKDKKFKKLMKEKIELKKKKIKRQSLIILVVGLVIGIGLISVGLIKQITTNLKYSENSKADISSKLEIEKQKLETKKEELLAKGVKYDVFAQYTDGEKYDLKVITQALDPSFSYCSFDEYKNNSLTSKYCSLKLSLKDVSDDFNKDFESFDSIPFYMIGGFVILFSIIISSSKKRMHSIINMATTKDTNDDEDE